MADTTLIRPDWPARPWIFAAIGALAQIVVHALLASHWNDADVPHQASAAFVATAAVAFAFVAERDRLIASLVFALAIGAVAGLVVNWHGSFAWSSEGWRFAWTAIALGIATPLFQAWQDDVWRIDYPRVHDRAWTNAVVAIAALVFTGLAWALVALLSGLFALVGLGFVAAIVFSVLPALVLSGTAFLGAVGLLRDDERIIGTLQRVVRQILSVFAPVLAFGLAMFLVWLPFSGVDALWATKTTTPIIITCLMAAIVLCNAVIGDRDDEGRAHSVFRISAMVLAVSLLPLGLIAATSAGARIAQHGLSPDRLWALLGIAVACAYGLAYLVALIVGRANWAHEVRRANLRLAFGVCGVALLIASPLLDLGAIATRDQMARIRDGRTPRDKIDWKALRFDFGPAGRRAVERMARNEVDPATRAAAAAAATATGRYDVDREVRRKTQVVHLRILPATVALPDKLREAVALNEQCDDVRDACVLLYRAGESEAFLLHEHSVTRYRPKDDRWDSSSDSDGTSETGSYEERQARYKASVATGRVEVRTVTRRQLFVGDEPVGSVYR